MIVRLVSWSILVLSICRGGISTPGPDIGDWYQGRFGEEDERIKGTQTPEDDVAFAEKLFALARSSEERDQRRVYLCDRAFAFAVKEKRGYETAIRAMRLRWRIAPDEPQVFYENITSLYDRWHGGAKGREKRSARRALRRWYEWRGDCTIASGSVAEAAAFYKKASLLAPGSGSTGAGSAASKSKAAEAHIQHLRERIDTLKKRLAENPHDDYAAQGLLVLYLVEKNNPAAAAQYLRSSGYGEDVRIRVLLAARTLPLLPELACLALGQWYERLHDRLAAWRTTVSPWGDLVRLRRAQVYYERFLAIHRHQDSLYHEAADGAQRVKDRLVKLMRENGLGTPSAPPIVYPGLHLVRPSVVVLMTFNERAFSEANGEPCIRNLAGAGQWCPVYNARLGRGMVKNGLHCNPRGSSVVVKWSEKLSFSACLSVAAWIKTDDFHGGIAHQHKQTAKEEGSFVFATDGGGKLRFGRSSGPRDRWCSSFVADNRWHHVAGVFDARSGSVKHYVDGQCVKTEKETRRLPPRRIDLIIGNAHGEGWAFGGIIDELAIFAEALEAREIQEIYQAGTEGITLGVE